MPSSIKSVAVIGGGVSGLSAANLLAEIGVRASVFEKSSHIGGLISCTLEKDSLFHRVGGHVFNSKNQEVSKWFWSRFDQDNEFLRADRNATIYLGGRFVKYPIELNLSSLGEDVVSLVVDDLISACIHSGGRETTPSSFQEFLAKTFGPTLCSIYFGKYNSKIWNTDLSKMPLAWLDGKLPMIKPADIIKQNIISGSDEMVHSTFYYPLRGGSQFIADRLAKGVDIQHVNIDNISRAADGVMLNGDRNHTYDAIVYTGDVRSLVDHLDPRLSESLGIDGHIVDRVKRLASNPTTTLFCECDANEYSWVYLPDSDTKFHRMIMTGNFSSNNNSTELPPGRITCTLEYSGCIETEILEKELVGLPFNPALIATNLCKASYIIHDHQTSDLISSLSALLEPSRIYLCGRFAEWKYFNMDAAIESAMQVTNRIARSRAS